MAVLGLLKEQDMHGYELKKRLSDVVGLATAVSFGSLYPALSRLEGAGAVKVVEDGAGGSRRRKVYGLTPSGSTMFDELLATSQGSAEDERSFSIRLAFARYLPPEGRLGLLEHRRAVLGERLAQVAARARARRDDRYMRVLADRQQESLSTDVSWLDRLIREERSSGAPDAGHVAGPGPSLTGLGPAPHTPTATGGPRSALGRLVPLASASQLQRASRAVPGPQTETTAPVTTAPVKEGM
jgi:DNA-binding PadR family transcriptional regulator